MKKTTKDRDELEVAIDKLRTELSKAEQSKKKLQHQVVLIPSSKLSEVSDVHVYVFCGIYILHKQV